MNPARIKQLALAVVVSGMTHLASAATFAVATPESAGPVLDLFGTRFRVGSEPLQVSHLGGYDANNDGPISVGIWSADGNAVASVSILYTGTQAYVYAPLGSPITLQPGLEYVVALQSTGFYGLGMGSGGSAAVDSFGPGVVPLADVSYLGVLSPPAGLGGGFEYAAGRFASANFQYVVVPEPEAQIGVAAALLVGLGLARRMSRWGHGFKKG